MLGEKGRRTVYALFGVLFLISVAMVAHLKPRHEAMIRSQSAAASPLEQNYQSQDPAFNETPFQALLPMLMGFREVVASLMWVQADDLFHRGEYGPILGLVRRIALIDPHNLDVYATGAWHMAYNFMDRRLVDDGVRFLEEGVRNNPHVYDLYFELGYMHYDKTRDYPQAAHWYDLGRFKPTTTGKEYAPLYVWGAYAHALVKEGNVDAALPAFRQAYDKAIEELKADPDNFSSRNNMYANRHNLYMNRRRINEREATWAEWRGNAAEAERLWRANVDLAHEYLKDEQRPDIRDKDLPEAQYNAERVRAGKLRHGAPRDLHFDFTWKRVGPRHIVIDGTCDILSLGRVTVIFKDVDYEQRAAQGLRYKMDNGTFYLDHLVQVKDGKFHYELHLDRDPADMDRPASSIFPLKSDRYELSVIFNPRFQSNEVQDRTGWNGEGMTTGNPAYVREDASRAGRLLGQERPLRTLQKTVILGKEDIV